ncbi:MAG: YaiI/YqxD family protein [Schwartzia sp.]|nr:YaiI/YqxD family protein [Schwartzia sp. (in: firmicutes)]
MKILVDADACPVVRKIESIARKHHIPVLLFCDTNHILHSSYSEVKTIGAGADAVDFALINHCGAGDIVITQDYGLAAMALGKQAYAMHYSGLQYTNDNISRLLEERHMVRMARRSSQRPRIRGIKNLMRRDDGGFAAVLNRLIEEASASGADL